MKRTESTGLKSTTQSQIKCSNLFIKVRQAEGGKWVGEGHEDSHVFISFFEMNIKPSHGFLQALLVR